MRTINQSPLSVTSPTLASCVMDQDLLGAMRARRLPIRERWEALLRTERTNTPMAEPDLLVHLIDETFLEIITLMEHLSESGDSARQTAALSGQADCPCGSNPLIAFFSSGEQAMLEGLILAQAGLTVHDPVQRDAALTALQYALGTIAHREISAFCSVCLRNPAAFTPIRSRISDSSPLRSNPGRA